MPQVYWREGLCLIWLMFLFTFLHQQTGLCRKLPGTYFPACAQILLTLRFASCESASRICPFLLTGTRVAQRTFLDVLVKLKCREEKCSSKRQCATCLLLWLLCGGGERVARNLKLVLTLCVVTYSTFPFLVIIISYISVLCREENRLEETSVKPWQNIASIL